MLRYELEPDAYTVDADFLNGGGDATHVQYDPPGAIIDSCERNGFAIVRNVLSAVDFATVYEEAQAVLGHHDAMGWTQRIESLSVTKVDKTAERRTELPSASQQLIGEFAMRLWKQSNEGERLHTPDATIDTTYVMRQFHSSQVGKHRDPVSGVMCELSLQGKAVMGFWNGRRKIATTTVRANDMVVMPAATPAHKSRGLKPIRHNVMNVTSKRDHEGERLALIYNYGRTALKS